MAAQIGTDEVEVGEPRSEPAEAEARARDPVERDHGPSKARTELVHVQPHAAIMGQRRRAGR